MFGLTVALAVAIALSLGTTQSANAASPRTGGLAAPTVWTATTSASVSIPPDGRCPLSPVAGGTRLSAGLGASRDPTVIVDYGEGATLSGYLAGLGGLGVPGASICVYSGVTTDPTSALIGVASTDAYGHYEFRVPPGPSRNLTAIYRSDEGQLSAWALLQVRAGVALHFPQNPVHNQHFGYFAGHIAGPDNDGVTVVMQAQVGRSWLTFSRYRTRGGGRFLMRHRFTKVTSPLTFTLRAQIVGAPGYPYLPGSSPPRELGVLP